MSRYKILVLDDDAILRENLERELNRNYLDTRGVGTGAEALKILSQEHFDIALIDFKLPDMSGLTVLEKIKSKDPDCEVIITTGFGTQDIAISALRKGAIDYLEKPVDFVELSSAIGRATEKLSQKSNLHSRTTILVVDDDRPVVDRLHRFLSREGFDSSSAYNGAEALAIIEKQKIDILVTDVNMGDMDGIAVLQQAKKMYHDIEGIVVTGVNDNEMSIKALRAGAADYLVKPVNLEELLVAIQRAQERIKLNRTRLYRDRELKISSEIISKMNEELERRIDERSRELSKTQTQLFQTSKLATLGEMSAGLAHEINQPLGGIALIAKTIRKLEERNKLTHDDLMHALDDIDSSVHRMTKIIRHIRVFSRQDTFKFIEVDVNDTIASSVSLLGEQLRLHSIALETDLAVALPKVEGEPNQLEQVWINLISNARDALDQKGTSSAIRSDFQKKLVVSSSVSTDGRSVVVRFLDNGVGIPETNKQKIFEPFFTTKAVGKGSGLGLSISYGIIDSHKGTISIENEPSGGVCAVVTLPARGR
jgi:two-component system NtrC family sensor kinase